MMALTKDKHYWTQLRAAITAGQWHSDVPGKDQKGYPLNWANLLRKFNKHCPGENEFAEVVSQTHHLHLQLAAGQQKPTIDGSQPSPTSPLDLDDETILAEERQQEGRAGYDVLSAIPSPSEVRPTKPYIYFGLNHTSKSTSLTLAYYAYSLSRPSECLDILSKVNDLTHPLKRIPASKSVTSSSNASQSGSEHPHGSSWTVGFTTAEHSQVNPNVRDGRAWSLIETVRSVCLKGISQCLCYCCVMTHIPRNVTREAASVRSAGVARRISFRHHSRRHTGIGDPSHYSYSRISQPTNHFLHSVPRTLEMGRATTVENHCYRRSGIYRRADSLGPLPPIFRV